jgi:hypothetical protein
VRPQASAHQMSLGGVLGTLAELPEASVYVSMQGTEEVRGRRLPPSTSIYAPDPRRQGTTEETSATVFALDLATEAPANPSTLWSTRAGVPTSSNGSSSL